MRALSLCLVLVALGCSHASGKTPATSPGADQEMRTLLTELVAVNTSNPPGNETAAARIAERWLREAAIEVELFEPAPGRGNLLARLKGHGGGRPLLVLAHLDTVPARREEWSTDPWTLTERDGFLYGRGVQDNKGMAAASVLALRRLQREKGRRSRDILLYLGADEEVGGGHGLEWMLANRPELREAEFALNEGGLTELSEDRRQVRFVALQASERVSRNVVLRATGPGGHSSAPPVTANPLVRLAAAVARVGALPFPARLTPAARLHIQARAPMTEGELGDALKRIAASPDAPPPGGGGHRGEAGPSAGGGDAHHVRANPFSLGHPLQRHSRHRGGHPQLPAASGRGCSSAPGPARGRRGGRLRRGANGHALAPLAHVTRGGQCRVPCREGGCGPYLAGSAHHSPAVHGHHRVRDAAPGGNPRVWDRPLRADPRGCAHRPCAQ
ncbi:peptidase, M20/M25/M40 family [Stigmatella aurantiaca DW4/3-1]|uniref:Peptidase, M20/M25/M40 family n=1 Tax=Stigmatella aurantiaca (strain DW4/3-1) TaxID=378806 RepID=Q08YV7_STIAD|nr:peptidase, M20/M25/M40 family [Stigmatella aurantiaca DW4/3-1]